MKIFMKLFVFVILGIGLGGIVVYFAIRDSNYNDNSSKYSSTKITEIQWDELQKWDLKTATLIPKDLTKLDGKNIKIPGFMIPLEDNQDVADEFLFVPSPMACIHVPAPPLNQIIHVKMATGHKIKVSFGPLWLIGKFAIQKNALPLNQGEFHVLGSRVIDYP